MQSLYFLENMTPADRDDFCRLVRDGGIDYPLWSHNGKTPEQATKEQMLYLGMVQTYGLKDIIKSIRLKNTGELVGNVCLCFTDEDAADLGYVIAKEHQGRGLATWAAFESVREGITTKGLTSIEGTVGKENVASQKILRKLGAVPVYETEESLLFRADEDALLKSMRPTFKFSAPSAPNTGSRPS